MPASDYEISVTTINVTENYTISDYNEPVENYLLNDDGTIKFGEIYRTCAREYGRCNGPVYIDTKDGTRKVGWYFVKRVKYDDSPETFLMETWITLRKRPVSPPVEYVTIP